MEVEGAFEFAVDDASQVVAAEHVFDYLVLAVVQSHSSRSAYLASGLDSCLVDPDCSDVHLYFADDECCSSSAFHLALFVGH